ncbi:MAG: hypothetical protein RLZZ350_1358 [Verrucomicrobiota bacterium]
MKNIGAELVCQPFSLTLNPSPAGRGKQQLATLGLMEVFQAADHASFAKTQRTFLPLPAGEGRGEGESVAIFIATDFHQAAHNFPAP